MLQCFPVRLNAEPYNMGCPFLSWIEIFFEILYFQGVKAIWSPHTGIVDWGLVTEHYGKNFRDRGGSVYLDFEVKDFSLVDEDGDDNSDDSKYPVRVISDGKVSKC